MNRCVGVSLLAAAIGFAGAGSVGVASAQGAIGATAVLRDAAGRMVGTASITEAAGGIRLAVQVSGLNPGGHGIHFHAVGQCDPAAFASAGAHFNPEGKQHGLSNPAGPHAGDLPALMVGANGQANYFAADPRVTLGPGPDSLFDADGSALVIHADNDDQMTDPTGNSGDRIVCGVVVRGPARLPATGAGRAAGALPLVALGALLAGVPAALRARRIRRLVLRSYSGGAQP
jgi:Cu-Zn family superoxide dismutase